MNLESDGNEEDYFFIFQFKGVRLLRAFRFFLICSKVEAEACVKLKRIVKKAI